MKIAVLSDVHGNLVALEEVLRVTEGAVDGYVSLGDVVNYGPWNDECLERIHALPNVTMLEGNHERLFRGAEPISHELPLVRDFTEHSRQWFSRVDLISDLPDSCQLGSYHCLHTIDGQSIYPDTPITIDRNYFIGHTHHQFHTRQSGFSIVNPGSVGQNRRWIDRADFAILDTSTEVPALMSIPYDVDRLISEMRSRRYPESCIAYYAAKPRMSR